MLAEIAKTGDKTATGSFYTFFDVNGRYRSTNERINIDPSFLLREMPADRERIFNSDADFLCGRLGLYLDYKKDSHKKGPDTAKITTSP